MADARKTFSSESGAISATQILRKIFLEDWLTKLVALAITVALWIGVTGLSTPTTRRMAEIPLTLSYSNKAEITNSPIQTVTIVISGDKRRVNQITESGLVVSLDLSDMPPGDRVIELSPENVSIDLPLGVKLQEIQPNRIAVRLEAVEEKEVPVRVETQGELADGYEFYTNPISVPQRVRVRGPASYIRSLTAVDTEKIDIADKRADFTARQTPIDLANPKATVLEAVVDVTFRIGEKRVEKAFSIPAETGGRRVQLLLYGPVSLFEGVKPADIRVTFDALQKPVVSLPPSLDGLVEVRKVRVN
ncbi:MAG: YbbR-like domain-containing protein [Pyrinomonadaceae bacterium]